MATSISNNPVSEEIDPGFGPDTEQRRVEFAAQLEQEAFDIALDDALKLARTYLITVMKIRGYGAQINRIKFLQLLDILMIWRIFDMAIIGKIYTSLDRDERKVFLKNKQNAAIIIRSFFETDDKRMISELQKKGIYSSKIAKIRDLYGGLLVFSMREKTFREIEEIFKNVHNKISGSMRTRLRRVFGAFPLEPNEIIKVLKNGENRKDDLLIELFKIPLAFVEHEDMQMDDASIDKVIKMMPIFEDMFSVLLKSAHMKKEKTSEKEVEDRVKRFYGIID